MNRTTLSYYLKLVNSSVIERCPIGPSIVYHNVLSHDGFLFEEIGGIVPLGVKFIFTRKDKVNL
jgi:hypothetical protein